MKIENECFVSTTNFCKNICFWNDSKKGIFVLLGEILEIFVLAINENKL